MFMSLHAHALEDKRLQPEQSIVNSNVKNIITLRRSRATGALVSPEQTDIPKIVTTPKN